MIAPDQSYHEGETKTLVIFDVRIPGAAKRLHSERASWGVCGDIEALDKDHYILIVRLGRARRRAA